MRKKDIIRLCEEHSDCQFTVFTNATLIDGAVAEGIIEGDENGLITPTATATRAQAAADLRNSLPRCSA